MSAPKPKKFSFCESVWAGPRSPWHIREVPEGADLKPGGGIQTGSLCGRVLAGQGWDLPNVELSTHHVEKNTCRACCEAYKAKSDGSH